MWLAPSAFTVARRLALAVGTALLVAPVIAAAEPCANSGVPGTPYEGFGADTPGGAGRPVYRVTTLADSGPGSLRDALSRGERCVVFDVAGDIVLRSQLSLKGAFVTVDGFSAPAPGITLRDYGLMMWGTGGVHDVIVRGLRVRNAGQRTCAGMYDHSEGACWDGIQVKAGASRVVIDHVSIDSASDGAIDVARSSDVTVQWSVLSGTAKTSLIHGAARVSMHHNLFIDAQTRNPHAVWDETVASRPPDTVLDFRNNVVWNFSSYGTVLDGATTANVVGNYYHSASRPQAREALVLNQARVYAAGNASGSGSDVDARGTEPAELRAAPVPTTDACRAAWEVVEEAGARGARFGPDAVDQARLARLPAQLPGCASPAPAAPAPAPPPPTVATPVSTSATRPDLVITSLAMPSQLVTGLDFGVKFAITNRGAGESAGSRVKIYLSADDRVSADDVLLRSRWIPPLAAGATQWHGITEVVPADVRPGAYRVLLAADAEGLVAESNERNNLTVVAVTVARPTPPSTPTPDLALAGVSMPTTLTRGTGFGVKFNIANRGTGTAQGSRVYIYLSTDAAPSAGDLLLRSRWVPSLGPGASQTHDLGEVVPADVRPGAYYVLLVVDATGVVGELNERNNVTAVRVTVR